MQPIARPKPQGFGRVPSTSGAFHFTRVNALALPRPVERPTDQSHRETLWVPLDHPVSRAVFVTIPAHGKTADDRPEGMQALLVRRPSIRWLDCAREGAPSYLVCDVDLAHRSDRCTTCTTACVPSLTPRFNPSLVTGLTHRPRLGQS